MYLNVWVSRVLTSCVWAAVGLCAAVWVLQWLNQGVRTGGSASVAQVSFVAPDPQSIARWLGAKDAPALNASSVDPSSARFALVGVANSSDKQSVAMISVDAKPAKAFRVGALVEGDLRLKSVSTRSVELASGTLGATALTLQLPIKR